MQAHDRSKDGQLCYDEFMRYPPHTHTHTHTCTPTQVRTLVRTHTCARARTPVRAGKQRSPTDTRAHPRVRRMHTARSQACACALKGAHALRALRTGHRDPRTTHAPGVRACVRCAEAPPLVCACAFVCCRLFAFGRMITPWFTRPPVRADDAPAKHLRGATGEWAPPGAQRLPGCSQDRFRNAAPHGSALLCATLSCRPPERSRRHTLASHAAPEGCESAPTRMLRGACCLERAVRSVSARSTRVLQATSPNSAFHRLVECFMLYFMCVQAPCSTWLNLSWCATLRAAHAWFVMRDSH